MPSGYIGYGSYLEWQAFGAGAYVRIPAAGEFKGGSPTVAELEDDNYDNTAAVNDFVPGFADYGDATFVINYDPADVTHLALWNAVGNAIDSNWKFHYSNAGLSIETFTGWVKGMDGANPVKGKIERTVTIRLTSKPAIT